ncbi:MAG: hypothetical protein AAF587_14520 [Bacteroidota bacterium]
MKLFIGSLFCMLFIFSFAFPQTKIDLPPPPFFENEEELETCEPEVKACIDYLITTPLGEGGDTRKIATEFFITWANGTSKTRIVLGTSIARLSIKNQELLPTYMAAWAKYELEHGRDPANARHAAMTAVMNLYKESPNRQEDPALETMLKKMKKETAKF